jgi:hypothetical protein
MLAMSACTATINIAGVPDGAELYVANHPMNPDIAPSGYSAAGNGPMSCTVPYVAWDQYYVWADAPGYKPTVRKIPNELKTGLALAGLFCAWPLWAWAYGPQGAPVYINLQEE